MRKQRSILLVLLVLCVFLGACSDDPGGMVMYAMGYTWEQEGNSCCIRDARFAGAFDAPGGEKILPGEGCVLMIVEAELHLEEEFEIGSCMVSLGTVDDEDHPMLGDPILLQAEADGAAGQYALLFEVPEQEAAEHDAQTYYLDFDLVKAGQARSAVFWFAQRYTEPES